MAAPDQGPRWPPHRARRPPREAEILGVRARLGRTAPDLRAALATIVRAGDVATLRAVRVRVGLTLRAARRGARRTADPGPAGSGRPG